MRHIASIIVAVGMIICMSKPASADLLSNGNMDLGVASPIGPGVFSPKPRFWNYEGFRTVSGLFEDGLALEPWAGPAPTPVTSDGDAPFPDGVGVGNDGGVFFKPFFGNGTTGDLITVHLYQFLPATPGAVYQFSGWAGAEANALMGDARFALEFLDSGGALVGSDALSLIDTLKEPNGEPFSYKFYSLTSTAPENAVLLRARISMIDGMINPSGGGQAYVVDDFTLTIIPEPAGALLLAAGIPMLLRRKRTVRA